MTWGELRKCRARSRSSERWGVGVSDEVDVCSWLDEESDGGEFVEGGWDGLASGCESSSLLTVIALRKS